MKTITSIIIFLTIIHTVLGQEAATFDNLNLLPETYWNGSDGSGGFTSGKITFHNDYNAAWATWSGFAYSNRTDRTTAGYTNQYSSITGNGVFNSANYAIGYDFGNLKATLDKPDSVSGFYVTNSTYAYHTMRDGDPFAKKFGGIAGSDPDFFRLIVTGLNSKGETTGKVTFYLADFRFEEPAKDYILNTWKWVDLSSLGVISQLRFALESSDTGDWGINTPAYFCMDNLNHQDMAPIVNQLVADINCLKNTSQVFRIPLLPVFSDPDNPDAVFRYAVEKMEGDPVVSAKITTVNLFDGTVRNYLDVNIIPNVTGNALVTISGVSNEKKITTSFSVIVTIPVGVDELAGQKIRVYPNPFHDHITIEMPGEQFTFEVQDMNGSTLLIQKSAGNLLNRFNNLEKLPAGMYILKAKGEKLSYSLKLLKK